MCPYGHAPPAARKSARARDNPAKSDATLDAAVGAVNQLGLDCLVTIGGDDTAYSASRVAERMGGKLRTATSNCARSPWRAC